MSSPSAYEVSVRENQRREEAARAAAVATATRLQDRLEALRAQAQELSASSRASETVDVPVLADVSLADSRAAIEAWIREAEAAAAALRAGILVARAQRADRKVLESLARGAGGKAVSVTDVVAKLPARPAPAAEEPASQDWRLAAAEEASRLAGRIGDAVFEDDRAAVTAGVADVAASDGSAQAAVRLANLRIATQRALECGSQRQQHRAEALGLLEQLRGLDHPDLPPTSAALQQVVEGRHALADEVRAEARRVLADASAAADERYAADVLAVAFADLGYDVQPGFATELHAAGATEFKSGRWAEFGVRVHVHPGQKVVTHLVRYGAPEQSAEADRRERAVAQAFCDDLDRVAQRAAQRGVDLTVNQQHAPGTVPVLVIHGEDEQRTERSTKKARERRL